MSLSRLLRAERLARRSAPQEIELTTDNASRLKLAFSTKRK